MTSTVELLEKRVTVLEQEVASLQQQLASKSAPETPAERGARLMCEARANQPAISAAIAQAFAEMGITGEPIGAENLQKLFPASGFKPDDNAFSRGIIEMREE
jgi:hypothetical protein